VDDAALFAKSELDLTIIAKDVVKVCRCRGIGVSMNKYNIFNREKRRQQARIEFMERWWSLSIMMEFKYFDGV